MAKFVLDAAGPALALDPAVELSRMRRSDLFSLAVRAKADGLAEDIVGTVLMLAVDRGSVLALGALAQMLAQRLERASQAGGDFATKRELRRTLREVETLLNQRALLDRFDDIRKEFEAAGEAVTLAEAMAKFRRAGVEGATHRILAPHLKTLGHLEGGGDEFRSLAGPLPIWRSPVSAEVLAKVLAAEFPHLAGISDDVATFVAGGSMASARPIALVGPPGIGKDSILRRAAELVRRPHGEFDLAGSSDNRILKGTAKGWSTASPCHAATICVRSRCANPLLQYSELDRAGGSRRNGMVHEALLGLCEPTTRRRWFDDGLGTELDLSDVAIGFTSNEIDDTPTPLLNRLRVLKIERPRPEHVGAILAQARRRYAAEIQVPVDDLPEAEPEVIERLEKVARQGRFHLRLADRIVRALGDGRLQRCLN